MRDLANSGPLPSPASRYSREVYSRQIGIPSSEVHWSLVYHSLGLEHGVIEAGEITCLMNLISFAIVTLRQGSLTLCLESAFQGQGRVG